MRKVLVSNKINFESVYSIAKHPFLGYVITSHVVQVNTKGELSLIHQKLMPNNFEQFSNRLDKIDKKLTNLLNQITHKYLIKKFSAKSKDSDEFFSKKFPAIEEMVIKHVNTVMVQAIELLHDRNVFVIGKDNFPHGSRVRFSKEEGTVLFHFRKNEDNTHYFITLKHEGEVKDFRYIKGLRHQKTHLLTDKPTWMLHNDVLFKIAKNIDKKKLEPFKKKKFIVIEKSLEKSYYQKFVKNLVEKYDVFAKGFEINTEKPHPELKVKITPINKESYKTTLIAKYKNNEFNAQKFKPVEVSVESSDDNYEFTRILRNKKQEDEFVGILKPLLTEVVSTNSEFFLPKEAFNQFLSQNLAKFQENSIEIDMDNDSKYSLSIPKLEMNVSEDSDWFDIKAIVKIDGFEIPFMKFRKHIINEIREYKLPNGKFFILPDEWFVEYAHVLQISTFTENNQLKLSKAQAGLLASVSDQFKQKVKQKLLHIELDHIPDYEMPNSFKTTLREYQKSGYNWLHFLKEYGFGGILADDMGLGKTIQTLAVLAKSHENEEQSPSLVIVPTSLVYNWIEEASKFTPQLLTVIYRGTKRRQLLPNLSKYDIIITSYGVVRQDIEDLRNLSLNYIILDESQVIKNADSKTAKAIFQLKSKNKLALTGTPIENTVNDLWSQMQFCNPKLLGGRTYFEEKFAINIEKKNDVQTAEQLKKMINPFILRRTKTQVAKELPPRVDQLVYCEMEDEQRKIYEEYKNSFRKQILEDVEQFGYQKTKFNILAALQKMRQIALHPQLAGENSLDSAKLRELNYLLDTIFEQGSKVIIFSQFVKMLKILEKELQKRKVKYAYIDGSVQKRMEQVKQFQEDDETKAFLISLKAGGTGLNLTAAQYVVIFDPWWNPAAEQQAIDRAYRIGQDKTVFTYKMITKDTLEEKILNLQNRKLKIAKDIITAEEDFFKSLNFDDMKAIFE